MSSEFQASWCSCNLVYSTRVWFVKYYGIILYTPFKLDRNQWDLRYGEEKHMGLRGYFTLQGNYQCYQNDIDIEFTGAGIL